MVALAFVAILAPHLYGESWGDWGWEECARLFTLNLYSVADLTCFILWPFCRDGQDDAPTQIMTGQECESKSFEFPHNSNPSAMLCSEVCPVVYVHTCLMSDINIELSPSPTARHYIFCTPLCNPFEL